MQENNWYEDWFASPYYSVLYEHRDEAEASLFLDRLIRFLKIPKGSTMLDVACGQGRHSIALAKMGFRVTGIDLSEPFIEIAKQTENENLTFRQHNVLDVFTKEKFDYVVNFFTSFGYFSSLADNQFAFENMVLNLKPKGIFVIDYLNPNYVEKKLVASETVEKDEYIFEINRTLKNGFFYKNILVKSLEQQAIAAFQEQVAAWNYTNFEKLFQQNNLRLTHSFGNYDLTHFHPASSPRMILVGQKQGV